jgi:hypothetical protein
MTEQSWTFPEDIDRTDWGTGPWDGEPDRIAWTDEATGRPCLLRRGGGGSWCGYVAVDPGHPFHGKDYLDDTVDTIVSVHGGLTYAAECTGDPERGICHAPAPGQPDDVWWFGFDAGHAFDLRPADRALQVAYPSFGLIDDVYRDVAYMRTECELLAAQLTGVARA